MREVLKWLPFAARATSGLLVKIYQCCDSELRCNTTEIHVTLNSKLVNVFLNLFAHCLTSEMLSTPLSKF